MKKTRLTVLTVALLGLGAFVAGGAQDTSKKSETATKEVACDPECGFMCRSHDEQELIDIVKAHAKQKHGKELTDEQVKEKMKTKEEKSG